MHTESTRRELLGTAASVVAGMYAQPLEGAMATIAQPRVLKALNVGDYSDPWTRKFVQDGNVGALVLWAPRWSKLEPDAGELDKTQWASFDRAIINAREDRCPVYVSVPSDIPDWAKPGYRQAPYDIKPGSPWSLYLDSVVRRHPHVKAVVALNEPNISFMHDGILAAVKTSTMIRTADTILKRAHYRGRLLVPAAVDTKNAVLFSGQVLHHLRGWEPHSRVSTAFHPYNDIKRNSFRQTAGLLKLLEKHTGWGGDNKLWLTELGYIFDTQQMQTAGEYSYALHPLVQQEAAQVKNLTTYYRRARQTGRVAMFANYTFQDSPWGGGGFMSGLVRTDGSPHPMLKQWSKLH